MLLNVYVTFRFLGSFKNAVTIETHKKNTGIQNARTRSIFFFSVKVLFFLLEKGKVFIS